MSEIFREAMGLGEFAEAKTFIVTDESGEIREVAESQLHQYEDDPYPWGDAMVVTYNSQGEIDD